MPPKFGHRLNQRFVVRCSSAWGLKCSPGERVIQNLQLIGSIAAKADRDACTLSGADEFVQPPGGGEIEDPQIRRGDEERAYPPQVERGKLCAELFQAQGAPFTLKIKLKAVGATSRGQILRQCSPVLRWPRFLLALALQVRLEEPQVLVHVA